MFVPLDFTALRTAPVEESVWPKSPATPKENVEVAAEAVGGLQLAGTHVTHGSAILVPKRIEDVATRVGLPVHEVIEVVDRLRAARLVLMAEDAGIEGDGFIVPEVGRLLEFLEFLNLKDRFGG